MKKRFLFIALAVAIGLVVSACAGTPAEQFKAWTPKFTEACKQVSEVKAQIMAADSMEDKRKIKTEKLDSASQNMGNLQKELKGILQGMTEEESAKAQETVRSILEQFGIS